VELAFTQGMSAIELTPYTVTDHDWLVQQHSTLYTRFEGFDDTFGPLVDSILTDFEAEHDPLCEIGWIAREGDTRLGSIFCVKVDAQTAKLRLFLLVPEARGKGLGRLLLQRCMEFAKEQGYQRMSLWTHESHVAACRLYEQNGWACTSSKPVTSFGVQLIEQQWEIAF